MVDLHLFFSKCNFLLVCFGVIYVENTFCSPNVSFFNVFCGGMFFTKSYDVKMGIVFLM